MVEVVCSKLDLEKEGGAETRGKGREGRTASPQPFEAGGTNIYTYGKPNFTMTNEEWILGG